MVEGFAARLRAKREEMGLSRSQLAMRSGICESNLEKYENRPKNLPAAFNMLRLSSALGVSMDWLFGRHEMAASGEGEG